jgi:tetratricopeptide (TPR) repeat protein
MFLNIILIIVIIICLSIVSFVIGRKFSRVKTLDVDTVPEAQTAKVRDRILIERMKRQSQKGKEIIQKNATPVLLWFKNSFLKLLNRIYALEKRYQKEASERKPVSKAELISKLNYLLDEAAILVKQEKFSEAEKKYIEIVSADPKNVAAYEGLTAVYLSLKEHKQALQTAQFILKLLEKKSRPVVKTTDLGQEYETISNVNEVSLACYEVGYIYTLMGKIDKAAVHFEKALSLEPNNPRFLDQMIGISIMLKNKIQAFELIKRLEEVNPENQKVKEYYEKIKEI